MFIFSYRSFRLFLAKALRAQTTKMAQVAVIKLITVYLLVKCLYILGKSQNALGPDQMALHAPHGPITQMLTQ